LTTAPSARDKRGSGNALSKIKELKILPTREEAEIKR
jgi:hypothetical protein